MRFMKLLPQQTNFYSITILTFKWKLCSVSCNQSPRSQKFTILSLSDIGRRTNCLVNEESAVNGVNTYMYIGKSLQNQIQMFRLVTFFPFGNLNSLEHQQ